MADWKPKVIRSLIVALVVTGVVLMPAWSETSGPAPNFTLTDREGNTVSLEELRGQVVMINFWASWCGPCREEMPLLEQIHQRYQPLGFTLLGVNVEENSSDAVSWLKDRPVSFPICSIPIMA